jgi:hypothetical protein
MAGPVQPIIYPVMWAPDPSLSFLHPPAQMLAIIESAGFRKVAWNAAPPGMSRASAGPSVQRLVMGDGLDAILAAGERNAAENRLVSMDGLFDRV